MSLRGQTGDFQTQCVVNDHALEAIRESEQFCLLTGDEPAIIEWQTLSSRFYTIGAFKIAAKTFSCHAVLSDQDWVQFQQLVEQWHRERGASSSPVYMAMCPAYQQIIAMGKPAIVLILKQLELEGDDPDHWFWALNYLTNADPVSPHERGNMKKMSAAWIRWGRDNRDAW